MLKADLSGVDSTKSLSPACCWLKRIAAALQVALLTTVMAR